MHSENIRHITDVEDGIRTAIGVLAKSWAKLNPTGWKNGYRLIADSIVDSEVKDQVKNPFELKIGKDIEAKIKIANEILHFLKDKHFIVYEENIDVYTPYILGGAMPKQFLKWNKVKEMVHTIRILRESNIFEDDKKTRYTKIFKSCRKSDNSRFDSDNVRNTYTSKSKDKQMSPKRIKLLLNFISKFKAEWI